MNRISWIADVGVMMSVDPLYVGAPFSSCIAAGDMRTTRNAEPRTGTGIPDGPENGGLPYRTVKPIGLGPPVRKPNVTRSKQEAAAAVTVDSTDVAGAIAVAELDCSAVDPGKTQRPDSTIQYPSPAGVAAMPTAR